MGDHEQVPIWDAPKGPSFSILSQALLRDTGSPSSAPRQEPSSTAREGFCQLKSRGSQPPWDPAVWALTQGIDGTPGFGAIVHKAAQCLQIPPCAPLPHSPFHFSFIPCSGWTD